jgi:hypothetical protein
MDGVVDIVGTCGIIQTKTYAFEQIKKQIREETRCKNPLMAIEYTNRRSEG